MEPWPWQLPQSAPDSALYGSAIIDSMSGKTSNTQLIVRNLEEEIVRELKLRAARHGRSAEAEHREILRQVLLRKEKSFKTLLLEIPQGGDDADFERVMDYGRDVEL